ncbi:MAG: DUF5103 domain-containing protein [Chitinophagales bacterium]|nr:DUF5103 domain-containing protein [Chitinophagales bacterium]
MSIRSLLMIKKGRIFFMLLGCIQFATNVFADDREILTDKVFVPNIKTVQLFVEPLILTDPVIPLTGMSQLHLKFDDLDGDRKNYFYTIVLCNFDWTISELTSFDYLSGFAEQDIHDSKYSFNTDQLYTHYDVLFPNENIRLTRSGNYIIKVYTDNDQEQTVLTKRFIVFENKVKLLTHVTGTGDLRGENEYQQIDFTINYHGLAISNPISEIKVLLLQNFRWDNALSNLQPQFVKPEQLEYFSANSQFEAGKEFRTFDTRTLKYRTGRVQSIEEKSSKIIVNLLPDEIRNKQQYFYSHDNNGKFIPGILDYFDQDAQPDYVHVHFSLPVDFPFRKEKIYLIGQFNGWQLIDDYEMKYNSQSSQYETTLFLKQGNYDYQYYFFSAEDESQSDALLLEGSDHEAENTYQLLVYYKPFGSRNDQVIGYKATDTYNH